jgi:hypothetical protein
VKLEIKPTKKHSIYGRFTVFQAERGGGPVLKGESSWTKVNGFMLRGPRRTYIFQFRRVFK